MRGRVWGVNSSSESAHPAVHCPVGTLVSRGRPAAFHSSPDAALWAAVSARGTSPGVRASGCSPRGPLHEPVPFALRKRLIEFVLQLSILGGRPRLSLIWQALSPSLPVGGPRQPFESDFQRHSDVFLKQIESDRSGSSVSCDFPECKPAQSLLPSSIPCFFPLLRVSPGFRTTANKKRNPCP